MEKGKGKRTKPTKKVDAKKRKLSKGEIESELGTSEEKIIYDLGDKRQLVINNDESLTLMNLLKDSEIQLNWDQYNKLKENKDQLNKEFSAALSHKLTFFEVDLGDQIWITINSQYP